MSQSFAELDVVRARVGLNDRLVAGSVGTVVVVYEGEPTLYEVEFMKDGATLDLIPVPEDKLELVSRKKHNYIGSSAAIVSWLKMKLLSWLRDL